jgi:hypothetical protein
MIVKIPKFVVICIFLICVTITPVLAAEPPCLIFHFNDGSASTALDSSGNGNNGKINGATNTYVDDRFGSALSFDGVNDYVNSSLNTAITGDVTISLWMKNDNVTSYVQRMADLGTVNSLGYQLCLGKDGRVCFDNRGGPSYQNYSTEKFNDGNWHQVTGVRKGNIYYLYVDGNLKNSSSGTIPAYNHLYVGKRAHQSSSPTTDYNFKGLIDEVKIYPRALSAEEILADYYTLAPPFPVEKTISITSPNGGESWQQKSIHIINWTYTGDLGSDVKIELFKAGTLDSVITQSTPLGTGSFSWTIPTNQPVGSDYKIKITSISDPTISNMSDNFSVTPIALPKIKNVYWADSIPSNNIWSKILTPVSDEYEVALYIDAENLNEWDRIKCTIYKVGWTGPEDKITEYTIDQLNDSTVPRWHALWIPSGLLQDNPDYRFKVEITNENGEIVFDTKWSDSDLKVTHKWEPMPFYDFSNGNYNDVNGVIKTDPPRIINKYPEKFVNPNDRFTLKIEIGPRTDQTYQTAWIFLTEDDIEKSKILMDKTGFYLDKTESKIGPDYLEATPNRHLFEFVTQADNWWDNGLVSLNWIYTGEGIWEGLASLLKLEIPSLNPPEGALTVGENYLSLIINNAHSQIVTLINTKMGNTPTFTLYKGQAMDKTIDNKWVFELKMQAPSKEGVYRLMSTNQYSILYYNNGFYEVPYYQLSNWDMLKGVLLDDPSKYSLKSSVATETINIIVGKAAIIADCPVDLEITLPDGKIISKNSTNSSGITYSEIDLNGDNNLDDIISFANPIEGNYLIHVIPQNNAQPSDTFALRTMYNGTIQNFVENITISQIPDNSFIVTLSENGYLLPINGFSNPPTDPDSDGLYEDLNGNARKDFNDVVVMFNQMQWIAANEPVSAFDFNGNGRIDFNDIVKLFGEI